MLIRRAEVSWETPWKVRNHIERFVALPRIRVQFLMAGIKWGHGWRIFGSPILQRHRQSEILLGDNLELRSTPGSNPLSPRSPVVLSTRTAGASIRIGEGCGLTGTVIVASERIEIGARVLIGANSTITDTDFHPLSAAARAVDINAGSSAPVVIEDDAFIGMQAIILKGVHIGRGSVVGAGSVVTRDVPAFAIVAGNPARVVGHVKDPG